MPANLRNASVGAANRAKITDALLNAGLAGIDIATLSGATGLCGKSATYYCRTTQGVVSAGLSKTHFVRWFHPSFAAGADAYRAALAAREKPVYVRWASDKLDRAVAIADAAGDVGVTISDIAAALGMHESTCSSMMLALYKAKRLQRQCRFQQAKRYFSLSVVLELSASQKAKQERLAKPKIKREKAKQAKKPASVRGLAPSKPRPIVSPFASATPIFPAGLKITVCPSSTDNRFKPDRVEPVFSALALGNYLRTGSAIERAYEATGKAA